MIGLILYLSISTIEFVLLYIQIKTNDLQSTKKRVVRTSVFLIICISTLLNIFEWGFRYYLLLIIYLCLLLFSELSYYKSKHKTKSFNKHQLVRRSLLFIIVIGISFLPSLLFPKYMPLVTTGIYAVETSKEVYIDTGRIETFTNKNEFRQVSVDMWYPENTHNTYPLIIYSHGGISLPSSNESLFLELASHGYIVYSIGHPYHSIKTSVGDDKNIWINQDYMGELNKENASEHPKQSYELYQKWMSLRTDDIDFVIDHIKHNVESENQSSVYRNIDIKNIAVIGHSLGGSAALCTGRQRADIKAVIALESPFMCDITDATDQGFEFTETPYPVPVLNIYSDSAYHFLSIWPQYQKNNDLLSTSNELSYSEHIAGSGHFSLTDLSLTSPILTRLLNAKSSSLESREILKQVNQISLEFLDKYLK